MVLVLVTLIALVACGGGQRMTVQAVATACGGLEDKFDTSEDIFSDAAFAEYFQAETQKWNPPEELQRLHKLQIEGAEAGIKAMKDTGILDLMQEFEEAQQNDDQERLLELMVEIERWRIGWMPYRSGWRDWRRTSHRRRQTCLQRPARFWKTQGASRPTLTPRLNYQQ